MATKTTKLEIRSSGGKEVEGELNKLGTTGLSAGKKIEKGGKQASKGLKAVDVAVSETNKSMRRLASSIGPVGAGLSKLGALGLAAAGGAAAAGGLFALTKIAAESANALLDQATAIGINVEALQEWQFVAEQSGVSADVFGGLMLKLSKRIGDITTSGSGPLIGFLEKFDKSLLDSLRSTTDFDQQLTLLVNKLGDLSTASEKASFADALFSESGREVGLVALQGAKRIEELRQRIRDLGGVISEDATKNAKELTDTIAELSSAFRGNFNNALLELAPTIKDFAKDITDLVPPFVDWINSFKDLDERGVGSLAREAAKLKDQLDEMANSKLPGFLFSKQIADTEEKLKAVNAQLVIAVEQRYEQTKADKERLKVAAELREEQNKIRDAAEKAAVIEKKNAEAAKKYASERKKILSDIEKLENDAVKAGLNGVDLLAAKRDEETLAYFNRLQSQLITSEEFARARLAIDEKYEKEKAEIAEKAVKESTKKVEKEAEKQASVFVSPFSTAASNIQSSFADTFTDIYRNGVTRFETLSDAIRDIMARLAGEITALMVIRPVIAGITGSFAGSAAGGTAGALAGSGASGGLGGFLAGSIPGGSTGMAATWGKAAGAAFAGYLATNYVAEKFGQNTNVGGNYGAIAGGVLGTPWGPLGSAIGASIGTVLGNTLGNLFGAGSNSTQRFAFTTGGQGTTGIDSPFGTLSIDRQRGVDAAAILKTLASIDEGISSLLRPEQISRVVSSLAGTGQAYNVNSFDNEPFDVVKTRLIRIIDSVAENTVASGLLNSIGRDPKNIDALVQQAKSIIEMINLFQDDGKELNQAEQAIEALNEQFDTLAKTAESLGFSLEAVEAKRKQATIDLTTDFNTSIRDQILAIEDPLKLALENVEDAAKTRLENARTLGADLVEVEKLNTLERQKVLEQFATQVDQSFTASNKSISSFLESLKVSDAGGLSVSQQALNADSLFTSMLGSARTDSGARADLAAFLPGYLDVKREQLGSTSSFFEFTSFLSSTLGNLVNQAGTTLKDEGRELKSIGEAVTISGNGIVDAIDNVNSSLRNELIGLRRDINILISENPSLQVSSM